MAMISNMSDVSLNMGMLIGQMSKTKSVAISYRDSLPEGHVLKPAVREYIRTLEDQMTLLMDASNNLINLFNAYNRGDKVDAG